MKTIVLALDALESTLIDLWSLDEFKQKHFGLYDTSQLEALSTPICFSAILTGKNPKTYGYTLSYLTQNLDHGYSPWLRPLVWMRRTLKNLKPEIAITCTLLLAVEMLKRSNVKI